MKIIYNLCEKLLRFILSCHIGKFNSCGGFHIYLGIAFPKGHSTARASTHSTHHLLAQPSSKQGKNSDRDYIAYKQAEKNRLLLRLNCLHAGSSLIKAIYQIRVIHTHSLAHCVFPVLSHHIIDVGILYLRLGHISTLYIAQKCAVICFLHRTFLHGRNREHIQEKDNHNCHQYKNVQRTVLWFFMVNIHWHFLHFLSTVIYFSISAYKYQHSAGKFINFSFFSLFFYFHISSGLYQKAFCQIFITPCGILQVSRTQIFYTNSKFSLAQYNLLCYYMFCFNAGMSEWQTRQTQNLL